MTNQDYIQYIRSLIAKDDITTALSNLNKLSVNTPLLNEVLHQTGRFENIKKQIRLGTVKHAEAILIQNQIRSSLLDLISEIEKKSNTTEPNTEFQDATSILDSKNLLVNSKINAQNVSIGDKTELPHPHEKEASPKSVWLIFGIITIVVIGLLAGLAEIPDSSLKDFFDTDEEVIIEQPKDSIRQGLEIPNDPPPVPKTQGPMKVPTDKNPENVSRNHFESHDISRQINIPDNSGNIIINQ